MRYLITALLTILLVAPFAWSRIQTLPSDGVNNFRETMGMHNGGGVGDANLDECLSRNVGDVGPLDCDLVEAVSAAAVPFSGTATLHGWGCFMQTDVDTEWDAGDYLDIAVYEMCTGTRVKMGTELRILPGIGYDGYTMGPGWQAQSAVSTCTDGGWLAFVWEAIEDQAGPGEPFQGQCTLEWTDTR